MFGSLTSGPVGIAAAIAVLMGTLTVIGFSGGELVDEATAPVTLKSPGGNPPNDDPVVEDPDTGSGNGNGADTPVTDASLQRAFETVVSDVLVVSVSDFRDQSGSLLARSQGFCEGGSDTLTELQTQWKTLSESWFALANYVFGPLESNIVTPEFLFIDSLRLRGTDYTETVRADLSADISGGNTLTVEYYDGKNFQRVGLLALEIALFETATGERATAVPSIEAEYASSPRKCQALLGLAGALDKRVAAVETGWLEAYRDSGQSYRTLFLAGETDDGTEPMAQMIIAIQEHLDYLQARNVVNQTAQIAGHQWQLIGSAVDSVERWLQGSEQSAVSFLDVLDDQGDSGVVATVRQSLANVREAISLQDAALLEVRLGELDGNFKRDIADALGIELGINFSDGD